MGAESKVVESALLPFPELLDAKGPGSNRVKKLLTKSTEQ